MATTFSPTTETQSYKCHLCGVVLTRRNRPLRSSIAVHLCKFSQEKAWEAGCVTLHRSHWQAQKALEEPCFHRKLYFAFHRLFEQK